MFEVTQKMSAVVASGGKQYRVQQGDVVMVERLADVEVGSLIKIPDVLAIAGKIGPDASSGTVMAEVLEHRKNDKEIIFKKKRRHNYRRKKGHRQQITVLRIKEVAA